MRGKCLISRRPEYSARRAWVLGCVNPVLPKATRVRRNLRRGKLSCDFVNFTGQGGRKIRNNAGMLGYWNSKDNLLQRHREGEKVGGREGFYELGVEKRNSDLHIQEQIREIKNENC